MKLSIIIPVFNVEKYILQCLSSIINQVSCSNFYEIIIVNDGTKDSSIFKAEEYLRNKEVNVTIINNTNHGLSYSRNEGLKIAKGDYIWFVDSDDWLEENSISYIESKINFSEKDLYVFPLMNYFEKNNKYSEERLNCSIDDPLLFLKKMRLITPVQRFVIKKELLLKYNLFFTFNILHEDIELCAKMLFYVDSMEVCNKPVYVYRRRLSGSIVSTVNVKRATSLDYVIDSLISFAQEKNSERYFSRFIFRTIDFYFYTLAVLSLNNEKIDFNLSKYNSFIWKVLLQMSFRDFIIAVVILVNPKMLIKYKIKRM